MSILTKDQANKLADKITKSGNTIRSDVQKLAVTAIGYANIHGDITVANRALLAVMSTKMQVRQFTAYCEHHGKLTYDKAAKAFTFAKRDDVETDPATLITKLAKHPAWHEFEVKGETVEVALYDKLVKILKSTKPENLTLNEDELVKAVDKAMKAFALSAGL